MDVLALLVEGMPRDSKESAKIAASIAADQELIRDVVAGLTSDDELIRARAASILERVCRVDPSAATVARHELLKLMDPGEVWSTRMHVARVVPLVRWTDDEFEKVLDFLFAEAKGQNRFVAAWALDALARLAKEEPGILPRVRFMLQEAMEAGSSALRARAKRNLKEL